MTDVRKIPLVIVDKRERVSFVNNGKDCFFLIETTSGGQYFTKSKIKIPNFGNVYYELRDFSESCVIKDF